MSLRPPEDHDFKQTPIFKQFVLKQTEEESLKDSQLVKSMLEAVIEEKESTEKNTGKKKKKRKTIKDFDADEQEALMNKALQRALSKMLREAEINYILNLLKKKDVDVGNDIFKITV